jgi:hypothetical protein
MSVVPFLQASRVPQGRDRRMVRQASPGRLASQPIVGPELQRDWEMRYSGSPWERLEEYIRSFWYGARRAA